jgi:hypothetical protein
MARFLVGKLLVDTTIDIKNSLHYMVKLCALLIRSDGNVARRCISGKKTALCMEQKRKSLDKPKSWL